MASVLVATPTNEFELDRQRRMAQNRERMDSMGLLHQRSIMDSFKVVKTICKTPTSKIKGPKRRTPPTRASPRLSGGTVEYAELSFEADAAVERRAAAQQILRMRTPGDAQALEAVRCNSRARGTVYDGAVGICCHFCRQKKLCGEEDCPRCANRDPDADCIGKSECGRCGSATGRFCRACLLVRYGQELDDVRQQMAGGGWLCPHCYEDDHPHQGWICNSSICMTRRGMQPTGIAIHEARQQGFISVAHLVANRMGKALGRGTCAHGTGGDSPADVAAPAPGPAAVAASGLRRSSRHSTR